MKKDLAEQNLLDEFRPAELFFTFSKIIILQFLNSFVSKLFFLI